MDAMTKAEGFYYSIDHLAEAGCIRNHNEDGVLAIHSADEWSAVSDNLKAVWGYQNAWTGPKLLKKSPMADGRTNYVFQIFPA